jgi:hypothetical protein
VIPAETDAETVPAGVVALAETPAETAAASAAAVISPVSMMGFLLLAARRKTRHAQRNHVT